MTRSLRGAGFVLKVLAAAVLLTPSESYGATIGDLIHRYDNFGQTRRQTIRELADLLATTDSAEIDANRARILRVFAHHLGGTQDRTEDVRVREGIKYLIRDDTAAINSLRTQLGSFDGRIGLNDELEIYFTPVEVACSPKTLTLHVGETREVTYEFRNRDDMPLRNIDNMRNFARFSADARPKGRSSLVEVGPPKRDNSGKQRLAVRGLAAGKDEIVFGVTPGGATLILGVEVSQPSFSVTVAVDSCVCESHPYEAYLSCETTTGAWPDEAWQEYELKVVAPGEGPVPSAKGVLGKDNRVRFDLGVATRNWTKIEVLRSGKLEKTVPLVAYARPEIKKPSLWWRMALLVPTVYCAGKWSGYSSDAGDLEKRIEAGGLSEAERLQLSADRKQALKDADSWRNLTLVSLLPPGLAVGSFYLREMPHYEETLRDYRSKCPDPGAVGANLILSPGGATAYVAARF